MNAPDRFTHLQVLQALAKRVRDSVQPPTAAALDRGLELLLTRATAGKIRRPRVVYRSFATVLAAVVVLVGAKLMLLLREPVPELPALLYRIEGGSVLSGGYLQEFGEGGVRLFFNDGTKVALLPGARGRMQAVETQGTRVIIDHGSASFDVARSKERKWFVEAGPFSVAVKGTFFNVSWEPVSERFELRLRDGSVVVSGPIASGDIELRPGQRLLVNLRKGETLISETAAERVAAASSAASSLPSASLPPPSVSVSSDDTPVKSVLPAAGPDNSASKLERKGALVRISSAR